MPVGGKAWKRALLAAMAAVLVVAAGVLGWMRANPPRHCPAGLAVLTDESNGYQRCCGQGQRLVSGSCVGAPARCAADMLVTSSGCVPRRQRVPLRAGRLVIAANDWEAEARIVPRDTPVSGFAIDSHEVVEKDWQECVEHGWCPALPLSGEPGRPMVGVTATEAERYCRFRGGALPTGDQLAFAARGPEGRRYPWGPAGALCRRAAFGLAEGPCGWGAGGPDLAGTHPLGATPQGVHDLAGNVAEWARRKPPPTEAEGEQTWEVRGGSWQDAAGAALRTWAAVVQPGASRSPTIGFRCAYFEPDGTR